MPNRNREIEPRGAGVGVVRGQQRFDVALQAQIDDQRRQQAQQAAVAEAERLIRMWDGAQWGRAGEQAQAQAQVQANRWIMGDELRVVLDPFNRKVTLAKPEIHGEKLFDLLLRNFKEIYEVDFTIAGGAVRDLWMGCTETSSDVDIFIPMSLEKFKERFNELGWKGDIYKVPVQPYNKGKDWDNSERASYNYKGMTLDLVFISQPLTPAMVQQFPIHAQRCVYTLESGMSISPEALVDLTNKKFTISPTITDKDYLKNLQGKITTWKKRPEYKDFKVVLPRCNEWWMKANSDHQTKGKVK